MNTDAHRALDRLFADCAADAGCREAFPDLPQSLAAVLADLEASPRRLDTIHPRTGEPFALDVSAVGFAAGPARRALQHDPVEPGAVDHLPRRGG